MRKSVLIAVLNAAESSSLGASHAPLNESVDTHFFVFSGNRAEKVPESHVCQGITLDIMEPNKYIVIVLLIAPKRSTSCISRPTLDM